jgi:hypothetical protein
VVQRDALQLLTIRGWRRRFENGDEWILLMREAKAGRGCSAIYGMEWIQNRKHRHYDDLTCLLSFLLGKKAS